MNKQIAVVSITQNGQDAAVYLDGQFLLASDPDCNEPVAMIFALAESLSRIHEVPITYLEHAPEKNWLWNEVQESLQASGQLVGGEQAYELAHIVVTKDGSPAEVTTTIRATSYEDAIRQLIQSYDNKPNRLAWVSGSGPNDEQLPTLLPIDAREYRLRPELGLSCTITVGNIDVLIKQEGEGVVVDLYPALEDEQSYTRDSVASTYAHYSECAPG